MTVPSFPGAPGTPGTPGDEVEGRRAGPPDRLAAEALSEEQAPTPPPPTRLRAMVWELVKVSVIVAVLVTTMRTFVVEAYVVHGQSMRPTFEENERLLISKFAPRFSDLERGDIVVFAHPTDEGKRLIKRVVGLPGETIEILGGQVYVDEAALEEPYATIPDAAYFPPHKVPEGCYFVLGDYRGVSNDSRSIGDVNVEAIVGRALLRFYPWSTLRVF